MRFEKLTSTFQAALADAQSLAVGQDNQFIEPAHMLLSLLEQKGTVYHVLQKTRTNITKLQIISFSEV